MEARISKGLFNMVKPFKLKLISRFICEFIQTASNVSTLLTDRNKHMAVRLDSSLANQRAPLSRPLSSDVSCTQENQNIMKKLSM